MSRVGERSAPGIDSIGSRGTQLDDRLAFSRGRFDAERKPSTVLESVPPAGEAERLRDTVT